MSRHYSNCILFPEDRLITRVESTQKPVYLFFYSLLIIEINFSVYTDKSSLLCVVTKEVTDSLYLAHGIDVPVYEWAIMDIKNSIVCL